MARPKKCRKVCSMPDCGVFMPADAGENTLEFVEMKLDEYEVIRLIDLEGYTQEQCAVQMGISRTTVTGIYNDARKKLAQMLVNGKALKISGGNVMLCNHRSAECIRSGCCRRRKMLELMQG